MARKKEEKNEETQTTGDVDPAVLSKLLIKELNKDEEKKGKMAWNLITDIDNPTEVTEFISTGSTLLDYIISNRANGGVPVKKITEINGEEATGKSLIIAHLIANCQKMGGLAALLDVENAVSVDFMTRVGVDVKKLVYVQPQTIEQVGETIEKIIISTRTKAPDKLVLIAWDSVAATPPQAEIEGTYDPNDRIGLQAKALAKMMRKLTQVIGKERICMVFTNQLKTKIGVMYGDPMGTPGGKAIPYHASVRVRLTRGEIKKEDDKKSEDREFGEAWGVHTKAKIIKNRLGPPLRKCEFDITFANGIDDEGSWFHRLHEVGEIEKADGWCYLSSLPCGRVEEKGVNKGKDRGMKFRERQFKLFLNSKPIVDLPDPKTGELKESVVDVKSHVLKLLEKHMIVRYEQKPNDMEIDPESLMDNEAVLEAVQEGALGNVTDAEP